ncbi:MAG: AAA family ATPase [Chloroflexota bacterium]|nr:AAA family ATPase [Chloroflexota bacterium]
MLKKLLIRNLGLIDSIDVDFTSGFTVLTGETGSGKSLIVRAIALICGAKTGVYDIRFGEDEFLVEGLFSLNAESKKQLETLDLGKLVNLNTTNDILLCRRYTRESKNIAYLNGKKISLKLLNRIGGIVSDIHRQGDHNKIYESEQQLTIFDAHAGLSDRANYVERMVSSLLEYRSAIFELEHASLENRENHDLINQQYDEISQAQLKSGELKELEAQVKILSNVQLLVDSAQSSLEAIYGSTDENYSLRNQLNSVLTHLAKASNFDQEFELVHSNFEIIVNDLNDAGNFLRKYLDGLEDNPKRLDVLLDRIHLIKTLMNKYDAGSIDILLERVASLGTEMEASENVELQLESTIEKFESVVEDFQTANYSLSMDRRAACDSFIESVKNELAELGMDSTDICINITDGILSDKREDILRLDMDRIEKRQLLQSLEFMIRPGKGESFKKVQTIASGGEAARLMLALKASSMDFDSGRSIVLDEIDYGIGGRLGSVIGKKLSKISINNQVICVTHLPQLAMFADNHIRIEKREVNGRTVSENSYINGAEKNAEIMNMYGGSTNITDTANQMLQEAGVWKQAMRRIEDLPIAL